MNIGAREKKIKRIRQICDVVRLMRGRCARTEIPVKWTSFRPPGFLSDRSPLEKSLALSDCYRPRTSALYQSQRIPMVG